MSKKVPAFVLALILFVAAVVVSFADLNWPQQLTDGQIRLQEYVQRVNQNLVQQGISPLNSIFELYKSSASLGITEMDNAQVPQSVELGFKLYEDHLNTLTLRVADIQQFELIAAACIQAASDDSITLSAARKNPAFYAEKVRKDPGNSFEDDVIDLNGTEVRTYYAYYPDQYHDGANWLQMTLIFPLMGYEGTGVYVTEQPRAPQEQEYEGYFASDDNNHYEVFTTQTPEPDSPAGGWKLGQ